MLRSTYLVPAALAALVFGCGGKSGGATSPGGGGGVAEAQVEPLERTIAGTEYGEVKVRRPRVTVVGDAAKTAAINAALGTPATSAELTDDGEAGIDYQLGFNAAGLLDVTIIHETMGAYPDSYGQHFLFDLTTGAQLSGHTLFKPESLPALAKAIDDQLQAEMAKARAEQSDCVTEDEDPYRGQFTIDNLRDVGVSERGVVFSYDYDFPHVIQACEPVGEFVWSLPQLDAYLAPSSPLRRIGK